MIITNEPGYYAEGEYGIRIENILHVRSHSRHQGFLEFENMTLVPYCKELIETDLLADRHREEIDMYYKNIGSKVSPLLEAEGDADALEYLHEQLDIKL